MPHLVCSRAIKKVADKTVAVGGHGNQINILFAGQFNDLVRGFAKGEDGVAGKAVLNQLALSFFQVSAVFFHFLAFRQLELIKISRHPAVGNMHQKKFCSRHSRQWLNVTEDGLVGIAVFKWDENVLIHFGI